MAGGLAVACGPGRRRPSGPTAAELSKSCPERDAHERVRLTRFSGVGLLPDVVLLELLVQVAARRADDLGGLRDVPAVLAQLLHQVGALGRLLELPERTRGPLPSIIGRGS